MSNPTVAELPLRPSLDPEFSRQQRAAIREGRAISLPDDRSLVTSRDSERAWVLHGPMTGSSAPGNLYNTLLRHASASGFCYLSTQRLCELMRVRERSVRKAIEILEDFGWVLRVSWPKRANLFCLTVPLQVAAEMGLPWVPSSLVHEDRVNRGIRDANLGSRIDGVVRALRELEGRSRQVDAGCRQAGAANSGKQVPSELEDELEDDEEEEERPHTGVNRIRDHLPTEDSFSSSVSPSRSQEKSTDEGSEHRELRAELRRVLSRLNPSSQVIAKGIAGARSWSKKQAETARSLIEQARSAPPPEVTESDRREYRRKVAAELRLLGVDRLEFASPSGRVDRLGVESWKHAKLYLVGLSRGVSSRQRAREIANSLTSSREEMYAGLNGEVSC